MKKDIAIIGFDFEIEGVESISFYSNHALIDYDIVIINVAIPVVEEFNNFSNQSCEWSIRFRGLLNMGKTVVAILNDDNKIINFNDESDEDAEEDLYDMLPFEIKAIGGMGRKMKAVNICITDYWQKMEKYSQYHARTLNKKIEPLLLTKNGDNIVSWYDVRINNGLFICLPGIDFRHADHFNSENPKYEGLLMNDRNSKGERFLLEFRDEVIKLEKKIRRNLHGEAPPDWVEQDQYCLTNEVVLKTKRLEKKKLIEEATLEIETIDQKIKDEIQLKALLYSKGALLEDVCRKAFRILGLEAEEFSDDDKQFDIIGSHSEFRYIGEVEGKDNTHIDVDKIRQLTSNLDEDFGRDDVEVPAHGILIGNAYRKTDPEARKEFFSDKVKSIASQRNVSLIKSTDLYKIVQYLSNVANEAFAEECVNLILTTSGEVVFPNIPGENSI